MKDFHKSLNLHNVITNHAKNIKIKLINKIIIFVFLNLGYQNPHFQSFNNHIRIIPSFNSSVYSSHILSLYTLGPKHCH